MKICFVGLENLALLAPQYAHHAAGAEALHQTLLARALARRGYEVSMVVGDCGQPNGAQWDGIRTFKARPGWTQLWRALARADAELYCADGAGGPALLLALFCAIRDRRLVLRASGARGLALHGAHGLLAGSAAVQRLLARRGLRSRIAGPLFESVPRAAAHDIDVLWMGSLHGAARPDRALSFARRLPQARVHMAGAPLPGDGALYREIRRMAGDIANLTFHAAPEQREGLALLGRAKLLLCTAEDESLPHAWMRAWANGVPVAALSDPGGLIAREGLGVTAGSPARLLEAVRALLEDEAECSAAGARCRRYMARAFSEARVVRAYIAAFESAARRGEPAGRMPLHA